MSSTRYARPLRNEVTRLGPAKLAPSSASKARCRRDYSDFKRPRTHVRTNKQTGCRWSGWIQTDGVVRPPKGSTKREQPAPCSHKRARSGARRARSLGGLWLKTTLCHLGEHLSIYKINTHFVQGGYATYRQTRTLLRPKA